MHEDVSVLSTLLKYINGSHKEGSALDTARALAEHFEQIPDLSIHDMADLCYVSSASLSRFTKSLGFESYPAFKEACRRSIGIDVDYSFHDVKAGPQDVAPIFERYKNHVIENIEFISQQITYDVLDQVCALIHAAPKVAFFGLEFATLISQHFQIKMAECNVPVKIGLSYDRQEEIARTLPEGSVVLIASLEGGYFFHQDHIIRILRQRKVRIIAFSMYASSRIQSVSDEIILTSMNNENTEGRISLLYVIELLIMFYYIRYK